MPKKLKKAKEFANESEKKFASLLSKYNICWKYEPRTFVLSEGENGIIEEAMTPDFWLEDYGIYIELTAMKQGLVTRKNRKARELRDLYPAIDLRLLYRKDLDMLNKRRYLDLDIGVLFSGTSLGNVF